MARSVQISSDRIFEEKTEKLTWLPPHRMSISMDAVSDTPAFAFLYSFTPVTIGGREPSVKLRTTHHLALHKRGSLIINPYLPLIFTHKMH